MSVERVRVWRRRVGRRSHIDVGKVGYSRAVYRTNLGARNQILTLAAGLAHRQHIWVAGILGLYGIATIVPAGSIHRAVVVPRALAGRRTLEMAIVVARRIAARQQQACNPTISTLYQH